MFYRKKIYYFTPIMLLFLCISFSSAQSDVITVTPRVFDISNLSWSTDGQTLVFQDACCGDFGVMSDGANWYAYDVITGSFTQSNHWQLDPQLTETERDFADIASIDFSFLSPDERYVVFSTNTEETAQLRLFDRQQSQFVNLPFINMSRLIGTDRFNVWWNEGSTALIIRLSENTAYEVVIGYAYIHNYEPMLENAEFIPLFYHVEIGGDKHSLIRPYDISPDGNIVLLEIFNRTGTGSNIGYYDPVTPENTFFVSRSVTGAETVDAAQFLEGNNNEVVYINRLGIYTYDRITGASNLIRDDIKSNDYDRMLFSPGGKHLALVKDRLLYLVDLTDDLLNTSSEQ